MSNTSGITSVVTPTIEEAVAAFRALDKAGRKTMLKGFQSRALDAFMADEAVIADAYKALVAAITAPGAGTDNDLDAAVRLATVRAMLANLEGNLTDRARELAITAEANPTLLARLEGTGTTRTSVSKDGANRSGSNEPKGDIMAHVEAALAGGAWHAVSAIEAFASTGAGYTDTYRPSGGAITAALVDSTDDRIAWRNRARIEVANRPNGGPRPVRMARIKPGRASA